MNAPAQPAVQETLYLTYSGEIDDIAVSRFMGVLNYAVTGGAKNAHILIQSSGGITTSGMALYNYLKGIPVNLTTYNGGIIASVAVIVYLAAERRVASETASFMIHKTYSPMSGLTAQRLAQVSRDTLANDERVESILKRHVTLDPEAWEIHKHTDLFIGAEDARKAGLIHEVQDFNPPAGCQIVNVLNSRA